MEAAAALRIYPYRSWLKPHPHVPATEMAAQKE